MAAFAGRDMRWKYDSGSGATVIAGARSDNLSITREGIDITDKDDAAARTFLDGSLGAISMEGSVEGVLVDDTLLALAADKTSVLLDMEIEVGALGSFEGQFMITGFEPSGSEGAEAGVFTCNLASSGDVPWTAA